MDDTSNMDKNPPDPKPPPYNDSTSFPSEPNSQSPPYPQYPSSPAGGAAYFPPAQQTPAYQAPVYPAPGYPSPSYPAPAYPPPHQQQQQTVVYVSAANPTPMIIQQQMPMESYGGYQALACIVFWFCNCLFGLIAWILALNADSTKFTDREGARRLGKASLGMSISGIIVSVIIVVIAVGVSLGYSRPYYSSSSCTRMVNGYCYSTSRYVGLSCSSYNIKSFTNCCYYSESYYAGDYCYTA